MVVDQFGMIGLLTFIRAGKLCFLDQHYFPNSASTNSTNYYYPTQSSTAETDPNLISLALEHYNNLFVINNLNPPQRKQTQTWSH